MGKPTKVHRQQRFQYERNRSKEWKKSKKLPSIECKQIKEAWNPHKSVKKNLRLMGLSSDPNVTFKIPTAKDLLKTQPENKQETKKQKQGVKTTVIQGLEAEASAPQPKTLQFSEPEVRYCIYMMEKYGDDYKAMARDRRNYYQDTPKQIKRKINSFKTTPHQYAAYIKLKGEWQLSLENESTPRKLVVDMVATARKPTRKYVARRRNGHFTSPKTPKKIQKVREEVPLHKVKRKLHFGRKPPTQRAVQSQEKAKNIQKKPVEKKSKQHRETLPSKGGAKMSKELMDLLQMADNFIIVENMRTKSSGKSCGDLKKLSINHKLRSSPEHMNLLRQH